MSHPSRAIPRQMPTKSICQRQMNNQLEDTGRTWSNASSRDSPTILWQEAVVSGKHRGKQRQHAATSRWVSNTSTPSQHRQWKSTPYLRECIVQSLGCSTQATQSFGIRPAGTQTNGPKSLQRHRHLQLLRKVEQSLTRLRSLDLLALAKMAWIRTDNVAKVLCTMDELRWTCCRLPSASSMLFCIYLILFVSLCFVGVHCTRSVPTIPASLEILCHSLWWRSIPCSVAQGLLGIVDCGRLWNNAKLCYSYNYLIQEPSKVFV